MADTKASAFASATPVVGDKLPFIDVTDTTNKLNTVGTFLDIINGDVNVDSSGVSTYNAGSIVNADVNASAAIAASKLVGTDIDTVGTITSGTWTGTAVASANLDADTQHLSVIQTITGKKTFGGAGAVGKLAVAGTTSGSTIIDATAIAGSGTVTLPTTGTLSAVAGVETLTNKTLTSPVINTQITGTAILDEDTMASNSALKVATQQSIKAYADAQKGADHSVSVTKSGNTAVLTSTTTKIPWDGEAYDTDTYHDTSTNSERFTVGSGLAGKYFVMIIMRVESNATGTRSCILYKNGSVLTQTAVPAVGTTDVVIMLPVIVNLAESDYIESALWQNSGSTLNVESGDSLFQIQKVDEAG